MLKKNSFSGGTNASTITTGNSGSTSGDAFQDVGGSPTYSSTNATGSRAPMAANIPSGAATYLEWSGWSLTARTVYVRLHVRLAGSPTSAGPFIGLYTGSFAGVGFIYINTSRQLSLAASTGATISGTQLTTAIPLNQWVRIEATFTIGTTTSNGAGELRLYTSEDSTTITESKTGSTFNFGTTLPSVVDFGGMTGVAYGLDDVGVTDVDWLGPEVSASTVATSDAGVLGEASSITISVSDTLTLTDACAPAADLARPDTAAVTETSAVELPTADTAALTDLAQTAPAVVATDTGSLGELAAPTPVLDRTDTAALGDTAWLSPAAAVADTAAVSEQAPVVALATGDTAALGEASGVEETLGPATADNGALADAASVAATVTAADTVLLDEAAALVVLRDAADTATLGEAVALGLLAADGLALAEAAGGMVILDLVDQAFVAGVALVGQPVAVSDSAALAETAAVVTLGRDITGVSRPWVEWAADRPYTAWAAGSPTT